MFYIYFIFAQFFSNVKSDKRNKNMESATSTILKHIKTYNNVIFMNATNKEGKTFGFRFPNQETHLIQQEFLKQFHYLANVYEKDQLVISDFTWIEDIENVYIYFTMQIVRSKL